MNGYYMVYSTLHFSLSFCWFLPCLYLVLVEPFDDDARGAVKPISVAHFLLLCASKISSQLVIDIMLDFHFELISLHVI